MIYKFIMADAADDFERACNAAAKDGYSPVGSHQATYGEGFWRHTQLWSKVTPKK